MEMRRDSGSFRTAMKRLLLLSLIALPVIAADVPTPAPKLGEKADKQIREGLPVCTEEIQVSQEALQHRLPINLTGNVVRVDSKRPSCQGQWVAATSTAGGIYLGIPWFLDGYEGPVEEKLKKFAWDNMKENWTAVVGKEKTREGFFPVTMYETTERGKLPFEGVVDPSGSVVFIGKFFSLDTGIRSDRVKALEPHLQNAPTKGAAKPAVTVVEFSDFECPSCRHAAGYLKPILEKYPDQVRYVRYDLPLIQMHPWALAAAISGRAIYRQKPDLFWEFKEQLYENQEKLSAFTIDDWTRNFAKDHDLDMTKYDADVNSPDLRTAVINGAGAALSNDVRATPTYMINGAFVDPGNDGKALEEYVAGLLKK
jgi:protein-disulfide isomerase